MRVAIDARGISAAHRGVGRTVMNLLLGLSQKTSDLEYIVFHSDSYLPQALKRFGGQYKSRFQWVQARTRAGSVLERAEIPWLARLHRIDLFHDVWGTGARLARSRSVATIHELEFLHFKDSFDKEKRIRKVLRRSRLVIASSEAVAGELESRLHVSRPKIRIVPGAIHPRFFDRASEDELRTMRSRFGLTGDYFVCVSASRQSKNLEILPQVFMRAFERGENAAPLALAVGWDEIETTQRNVPLWRRARDAGAIRFLGTIEDAWLRLLYAASSAVIVPSFYEGFSLAAIEGLACSAVPVLSKIAAHRSIFGELAQGTEMLFFDPAEPDELQSALERLRDGGEPLRGAVLEKFKEICHRYAVIEVAERTQRVYHEAAEGGL